jgi:hypothetical protein
MYRKALNLSLCSWPTNQMQPFRSNTRSCAGLPLPTCAGLNQAVSILTRCQCFTVGKSASLRNRCENFANLGIVQHRSHWRWLCNWSNLRRLEGAEGLGRRTRSMSCSFDVMEVEKSAALDMFST